MLAALGYDAGFATDFAAVAADGLVPARVILAHAREARVHDGTREWRAAVSGKVRRAAVAPTVGDWVAARPPAGGALGLIEAVLPRRTVFARRAAGTRAVEQLLAANVDVAFLVMGLDADYNLRRLERYLTLCHQSGAQPVVVLSKADLAADVAARVAEVQSVAGEAPVIPARLLEEIPAALRAHVQPGRTVVLLGSSGAGKSTLINRLCAGDVQKTRAVRASDQRGQHTTTNRQLFAVPGGGLVIDSPGLRELQLWDADEGLEATFEDIERLAAECRFRDCRHRDEPGCAVRAAADEGAIAPARLASFHKLAREAERQAIDEDAVRKRKQKAISRARTQLLRTRLQEKKR
jgi:ribosome biogenesis GTPase